MIKFKLNKSSALSILNPSCIIKLQTGWKQNNAIRNKQKNIQKKKKRNTYSSYQLLIFSPCPSLYTQLATINLVCIVCIDRNIDLDHDINLFAMIKLVA